MSINLRQIQGGRSELYPHFFWNYPAWVARDADALVKYGNNDLIWKNLRDGFLHPYTLENARAFLARATAQDPVTYFAIATPEEASVGSALPSTRTCTA